MTLNSKCTPPAGAPPIPGRWERNLVYAFAWLPPLGVLAYFMPMLSPIFTKLNGVGELPQYSYWVWRFVTFNEEYFCLPMVLVFVMLRALAEYFIILTRRAKDREVWVAIWRFGAVCSALVLWGVCCTAPLLPVFRMGRK